MAQSNRRPVILLAEDDADLREAERELLESEGYRVITARDGLEVMEALNGREKPGLVLLDLRMPVLDGRKVIERLRAGGASSPPVVVLSSFPEDAPRGVACFRKPVDADSLLAAVAGAVKSARPAARS